MVLYIKNFEFTKLLELIKFSKVIRYVRFIYKTVFLFMSNEQSKKE